MHRDSCVRGQLGPEAETLDHGLPALPTPSPPSAPGEGAWGPERLVLVFQKLTRSSSRPDQAPAGDRAPPLRAPVRARCPLEPPDLLPPSSQASGEAGLEEGPGWTLSLIQKRRSCLGSSRR